MKTLLFASAMVAAAATTLAQGTIKFSNYSPADSINALVYAPGAVKLGTAYLGQLYAGASIDSLAPVGAAVAFKDASGVGTGIVSGGTVTTALAAGSTAYVQLKAWEASGGASYEAAKNSGKMFGSSEIVKIDALGGGGSPPAVPAPLKGLQSFTLVPEPSTLALGVLGAAALMLRRRS